MDKDTKKEFENLAGIVKRGFDAVHSEIGELKKDTHIVKGELSHMNAQLSMIEHDVADIKRDIVSRDEFEDLMGRVKYLELKLGIESGK